MADPFCGEKASRRVGQRRPGPASAVLRSPPPCPAGWSTLRPYRRARAGFLYVRDHEVMSDSEPGHWEYRTMTGRAGPEFDQHVNKEARQGWEAIGITSSVAGKTFWKSEYTRTTVLLRKRLHSSH